MVEARGDVAIRLVEKPEHPPSNLAIVGLYWIRKPRMLEECIAELFARKKTTKGEYQLTDALQLMLEGLERRRLAATPPVAEGASPVGGQRGTSVTSVVTGVPRSG